jgi:hypothetical protein
MIFSKRTSAAIGIAISIMVVSIAPAAGAAPLEDDLEDDPQVIEDTQAVYDPPQESGVIGPDRAVTVTRDRDSMEELEMIQQNQSANSEDESTQLTDQLGDLWIHSYEFTKKEGKGPVLLVTVTWQGRAPETVSVTQLPGDGADRIAISRNRLPPEERTVLEIDLVADDEPAIIYSEESINRERAAVLSPNRNSSRETTLIRGVGIGILTMLIGTVLVAFRYQRVDREPVEGWDP